MRNLTLIPDKELTTLKTKQRSICEKDRKIEVSYKYKKVIDNISENKGIVILRHDRGRGVVILDTSKYTEKCMALLNTEHFKKNCNRSYCSHGQKDTKSFEKNKI